MSVLSPPAGSPAVPPNSSVSAADVHTAYEAHVRTARPTYGPPPLVDLTQPIYIDLTGSVEEEEEEKEEEDSMDLDEAGSADDEEEEEEDSCSDSDYVNVPLSPQKARRDQDVLGSRARLTVEMASLRVHGEPFEPGYYNRGHNNSSRSSQSA